MSDFVTANPYEPGSLEDQQQLAGQLAALKLAPPATGRGVLSQLLVPAPDTGLPPIPGAVSAPVSVLDSVIKAGNARFPALQQLDNSLGVGNGLYGGDIARQAFQASQQRADDWSTAVGLPPPGPSLSSLVTGEPTTEQKFNSAMEGVGASLGFPVSGIPSMPIRALIKTVLPGSVAPVAGPITSGLVGVGAQAAMQPPPGASATQPVQPPAEGSLGLTPSGELPPPTPPLEHDSSLPFWGIAGLGIATVAMLGYGPRIARSLDSAINLQRGLRTFDDSAPFNAFEHARTTGTTPLAPTGPTPEAPIPGRTAGVVANAALVDKDAELKAYQAAVQPDRTSAELARAKAGLLLGDEASHSRLSTFVETGHDQQTGIQVPSIQDHWIRVGQFSPEQRTAFDEARMASDEIDNRVRVFNQLRTGGGAIPDEDTRVWFKDKDSAALRKMVADARLDPSVAGELDAINSVHRGLIDIAGARGYFTNAEVASLKSTHPNYLPTVDVNGNLKNPFEARNIEPGAGNDVMSISPSEADKQHVQTFMRTLEKNEFLTQFYQDSVAYQNRNATFGPSGLREGPAEIVEAVRNSHGDLVAEPPDDGSTIAIKINGVTHHVRVKSPALLQLLSQGPKPLGAFFDAMSAVRQLRQSTTTGVGAALGGRLFPPVNAFRDALLGSATRPQGTAYGVLDAVANKVSGGRFGLPGDFLTALPLQAYGMGADTAALMAGRVGKMLTPGFDNPVNNFLRWTLGDPITDAMQRRIQAQYYKSVMHDARQRGIVRAAGFGTEETPVFQVGALNRTFTSKNVAPSNSPLNNMAPGLFRANDPRLPFTNIQLKGLGRALVPVVRFNELVHDLFNVVNDSAKMHFLRMNEGKYPLMKWTDRKLPRDVMSMHTREVAGDMAQRGKNTGVRMATSAVPYLNPSIQGMAAAGRSIRQKPLATFFGAVHALSYLALAAGYLAAIHGQDAIDHQHDMLSAGQQARSVYLYHPDYPPDMAVQLPLPQEFQTIWPIALQFVHDAFGIGSHFLSDQARQSSLAMLTELLSKHVTYESLQAGLAGVDALTQVGAPPLADAVAGAYGKSVVPFSVKQLTAPDNKPIQNEFVAPAGSGGPLAPDRPDPTADGVFGKVTQGLAKAVYGILADTAIDMWHGGKMEWDAGGSTGDALSAAMHVWQQSFRDKNPMFNGMLWVNETKLSRSTQLVERTNYKLNALAVTKGAATDISQSGLTRSGGEVLPDAEVAEHKVPTDPVMKELWFYASQQNSRIRSGVLKFAQDTKKQMDAVDNVPGQPVEATRMQHNLLDARYQQRMGRVADELRDVEHHMEQMLGGGHVALEHIDWSKGPEQFSR